MDHLSPSSTASSTQSLADIESQSSSPDPGQRSSTAIAKTLSGGAVVVYILRVLIYILITSQNQQLAWFDLARMVIIGICLTDGVVVFLSNKNYIVQNKLEILFTFLIFALFLKLILGNVTDGVGIVMTAVFLATLFPELREDLVERVTAGSG